MSTVDPILCVIYLVDPKIPAVPEGHFGNGLHARREFQFILVAPFVYKCLGFQIQKAVEFFPLRRTSDFTGAHQSVELFVLVIVLWHNDHGLFSVHCRVRFLILFLASVSSM